MVSFNDETVDNYAELKQKRHLAVMFIDLVDSTRISSHLDSERFHDLISGFLDSTATEIERHGGYVARFMGDGVLAYFGYPTAKENDSVSAIKAALMVKHATNALALKFNLPLAVRIGIAAGTVIMDKWLGKGSARERPISGLTVNLAARLQSAAVPNSILVSDATYQLVENYFDFQLHGQLNLKGLEGTSRAFEVLRAKSPQFRLNQNESVNSRMVSRTGELAMCLAAAREAQCGKSVVLALTGEAGIGKTTLAEAFLESIADLTAQFLCASGNPSNVNEPYFIGKQLFGTNLFSENSTTLNELATAALHALSHKKHSIAQKAVTILFVEDIHWVDPSSLDLLAGLVCSEVTMPLLLVCTSRFKLPPQFQSVPHLFQAQIDRLDEDATRELLQQEVGANISSEVIECIWQRSEGVPLFALELSRLVQSRQDIDLAKAIPHTLSEMLSARLSQLRPAFRVAQCLSVLGLSGELVILASLAQIDDSEAERAVQHLVEARAIKVSENQGHIWLRFEHSLIRDAIYETLFDEEKRRLHRDVASLLNQAKGLQTSFDVLADHYNEAGEFAEAVKLYIRAGRRHHLSGSYREAELSLGRGLAALESLATVPEKVSYELELQNLLAEVLQINLGYSNPLTLAAANRAKALAEKQGEFAKRFGGLAGEWMAASSAGSFRKAHGFAERMRSLALMMGGDEVTATSWMALLTARFRLGDFLGAEEAFVSGKKSFLTERFLSRPGAIAQTFGNGAQVCVFLGEYVEARRRAAFAIWNSRRLGSQYDISFSTYMAAMVCLLLGDDKGAFRLAGVSLALAKVHSFPQFLGAAQIVFGRAKAGLGEAQEGIALMQSGLKAMDAVGSKVGQSLYLTWLAEAYCFAGQHSQALLALEQAQAVNPEEQYFLPEILRLKSRLIGEPEEGPVKSELKRTARALADASQGQWFLSRMFF